VGIFKIFKDYNKFNIYGKITDAIYFESKYSKEEYINKILYIYGKVKDEEEPYFKNDVSYIKYNIKDNVGKLNILKELMIMTQSIFLIVIKD
jgi:hypothetical protein